MKSIIQTIRPVFNILSIFIFLDNYSINFFIAFIIIVKGLISVSLLRFLSDILFSYGNISFLELLFFHSHVFSVFRSELQQLIDLCSWICSLVNKEL